MMEFVRMENEMVFEMVVMMYRWVLIGGKGIDEW